MCTASRHRSRRDSRPWLLGSFLAAVAAPALAAGEEPGRYTMTPTEGGVIRLDRETGAMSICTGKEGEWSCKAMPDTEDAMKKRVERLEGEKRALEAEKQLRNSPLGGPIAKAPATSEPPPGPGAPHAGDTVPPGPPGDLPVPTEQDVDKLFDYVEGMVKKFKERIDRLEREAKKEPDVPL